MKKTKRVYKKATPKTHVIPPPKKRLTTSALVIMLFFVFSVSTFLFVKTHVDLAANFADDILRPLIGNKSTITLEAIFFNVEDHINQLNYQTQSHGLTNSISYAQTNFITGTIGSSQNVQFTLDPIKPLFTSSEQSGEGQWIPLVSSAEGTLIAKTVLRTDQERPYAHVTLVKMDMTKFNLDAVAGQREPGGPEKPGSGKIPAQVQASNNLIAAFNGGFQKKDGYYGMIAQNETYLPLQQGLATLVIKKNDTPALIRYEGQNLGDGIVAVRQNGPMLIENGQIVTSSKEWNMQTWGLTTTNSMYTWRSGLGVTKNGDLVFACGPSLVPETLAKGLLAAGATNAMQLDINPIWVRYVLFHAQGNGQYTYDPIEADMVNGGSSYLNGYQKDFFYLFKK